MLSNRLKATLQVALTLAAARRHEYATLEHLLLALLDDPDAAPVLATCRVNLNQLRADLAGFLERDLVALVTQAQGEPTPTAGFQRVVQRAALSVQSSGPGELTGAHILVALFTERESHAVYFLQQQGMTESVASSALPRTALSPTLAWIFVATPPGSAAQNIRRQSIVPAIEAAGHQAEPASLTDGVTGPVLEQIRHSRLVVADMMRDDGAVQFVVGLAVGLGIPLVPICHANSAPARRSGDTRQQGMLFWHTAEDLADKLEDRIVAVLGRGRGKAGGNTMDPAKSGLLDATTVAVRQLIAQGKARGYVTYEEFYAALPAERVSPELIEDTMAMLHELDINVIESGGTDS